MIFTTCINSETTEYTTPEEDFLFTTEPPSPCDFNEEFVDGECVDLCFKQKRCGTNTNCSSAGLQTYCSCLRGYTGNPLTSCFKMDEKSPCDPNPCGPNAECHVDHPEIGPHCRCKEGFYDWPPACREGCKVDTDCGPTEFCNSKNSCEDLCGPEKCGENSICRVDKKKRTVNCSCKDGYLSETGIGCRLKAANESDIPLDFFTDFLFDKCEDTCGYNAYCDPDGKCVCTQDYTGDPLKECQPIALDRTDPCTPNPCGGYSTCEIVNDEAKCSCIEGHGTAPYCSKCYSNTGCPSGDLCVEGKCVFNVCKPNCGYNAGCTIHEGRLECSCEIRNLNEHQKPFQECSNIQFISAAVIATLAG